ncbi:MAG: hypothetical protein ACREFJ_13845 [Acetobacteraceae bacterium]
MNLAQNTAKIGLIAQAILFDQGTLELYQGSIPASPETALSSAVALGSWTFSIPDIGTPSFGSGQMSATVSFVSTSMTPSVNGTACFARATLASAAWAASHVYAVGDIVTNNSNFYLCILAGTSAASGGPTTAVWGITDGTAGWAYIGASSGQNNVLCDLIVGAAWVASTAVIVGQYATNGGNLYLCSQAGTTASSGGPSGTGSGIVDGSAKWNYGAAGGADITLSSSTITANVAVTMSSASFFVPAV